MLPSATPPNRTHILKSTVIREISKKRRGGGGSKVSFGYPKIVQNLTRRENLEAVFETSLFLSFPEFFH
jgi:hypothetical protein